MGEFLDRSYRDVVQVSASSSPTPGGGSVSALVASLGVAMASMVCNLTVGKEKYKDVEPKVQEILDECNSLIGKLEELVDADMAAFEGFMKVFRMPRNTDEEKAKRAEIMQAALKKATDVPMEIARTCLRSLEITEELSHIGNKMAISDAGVAAYVSEAALNSVLLSADINIPMIKDKQYVDGVVAEKEKLVEKAASLKGKAVDKVQERMK